MKDLISVIVPIFNVENYLSHCIDSLISQSYPNLEIILINDGSTDRSKEICESYLERDKRIFYIEKENEGVSSARNLGLSLAKGNYILFVDSDDYIGMYHIEILYSSLKKYNADISIGSYTRVVSYMSDNIKYKPTCIKYKKLNKKETLESMLINDGFGWEPVAKLFSKKIVNDVQFDVDKKIGEDFSFMYRVLSNVESVVIISSKDYFYMTRLGSATKKGYNLDYDKLLDISDQFQDFVRKFFPEEKWMISFFYIHCAIEILDRLICLNSRNIEKEAFYSKIIKKHYFSVLFSKKVPIKFKIKISFLLINKSLYMMIKELIRL